MIGTENLIGIATENLAVIEEGIMIVGAGTGIMSEIVDTIGSVREIMSAHAMIQEVAAGHVLGLGNVPGIMIGTGTCFCIALIKLIFLSI